MHQWRKHLSALWRSSVSSDRRCLENVKDGKSVAPSLRLMQRIIDAQPESSTGAWGSETRGGSNIRSGGAGAGVVRRKDEILETLDRDHNLLNLLVDVSIGKCLTVFVCSWGKVKHL